MILWKRLLKYFSSFQRSFISNNLSNAEIKLNKTVGCPLKRVDKFNLGKAYLERDYTFLFVSFARNLAVDRRFKNLFLSKLTANYFSSGKCRKIS